MPTQYDAQKTMFDLVHEFDMGSMTHDLSRGFPKIDLSLDRNDLDPSLLTPSTIYRSMFCNLQDTNRYAIFVLDDRAFFPVKVNWELFFIRSHDVEFGLFSHTL
jgi:hypothetical protein